MAYELHRVDHSDQIAKRRDEWLQFSRRCPVAAPFCRGDVWLSWLDTFLEFPPVVYELREDGDLVALLPMYLDGQTLHVVSDRHLDYQDIAAVSTDVAVTLISAIIEREGGEGMALSFAKVAEHSRLHAALVDERLSQVASVRSRFWSVCPATEFEVKGPGKFIEALRSRQRKDYKAARRKMSEAFSEHVIEHRLGSEIDLRLLEEIAHLHRSNQYRKKGKSIFADLDFVVFLQQQANRDAPLLISTLRERPGTEPFAFHLGYFSGGTYYYYLTAYDGENSELSPGRYLLIETLSNCADRMGGGRLRFDLLSGEEAYKSRWAKTFYEVSRFRVIPKRLGNLPLLAAYSTVYGLKGVKNRWRERFVNNECLSRLEHECPGLSS